MKDGMFQGESEQEQHSFFFLKFTSYFPFFTFSTLSLEKGKESKSKSLNEKWKCWL